tara:strand:+ start:69476 stop:73696 length:4221 start_codon:yes stop_codon:yes gene_type:complete
MAIIKNIVYNTCQTKQEYLDAGYKIVENNSGTVSVYDQKLNPIVDFQNSACCKALGYTFDIERQQCRWVDNEFSKSIGEKIAIPVPIPEPDPISDVFRIVVNPVGGSSTYFTCDNNEDCSLEMSFDWILNFDCKELLGGPSKGDNPGDDTSQLEELIRLKQAEIDRLEDLIATERGYNIPFVVECNIIKSNYALTVEGLKVWEDILNTYSTSRSAYAQWLFSYGSNTTMYGCDEVEVLTNFHLNSKVPLYVTTQYLVTDRATSEARITQWLLDLAQCESELQILVNQLPVDTSNKTSQTNEDIQCVNNLDIFEDLDVRVNLEVVNPTTGLLQTVYQDTLFNIPANSLSDYIVDNYGKTGLLINGVSRDCTSLSTIYAEDLIDQYANNHGYTVPPLANTSKLADTSTPNYVPEEIIEILNDWFETCWLKYRIIIDDDTPYTPINTNSRTSQDLPSLLDVILNKEINISISIHNTCVDFAILLDNVILKQRGEKTTNVQTYISEPPSFNLKKVIDNKKSWLSNEVLKNREFDLQYRITDYDIKDNRLAINTKEIDLNLSPSSAIETDVCCFSRSNPSIFYFDSGLCEVSGVTYDTSTTAIEPIVTDYASSGYTYQGVTDCQLEFTLANQLPVDTDIYAIFDTTSMLPTDGEAASDALNEWFDSYTASTPTHQGNLYIIPHGTEEWLDYANRLYTGVMPVSVFSGWTGIAQLPPDLNTSGWTAPTDLVVLAFVDEAHPSYHSSKVSDGFNLINQPTTGYTSNLDTFTGTTHPSFTFFKGVVYPIVRNIITHGGALVLQTMAAMEARLLTASEIVATNTTVDVSLLLTENAYIGLPAMKDYGWKGVYDKVSPASEVFNSESFGEELNELLLGDVDLTTVLVTPPVSDGNVNLQSVGCFNINSCVFDGVSYDTSSDAIASTIAEYEAQGYIYRGIENCQLNFDKFAELPPNADIYGILDTTSMTLQDGIDASDAFMAWFVDYKSNNPSYLGEMYIIPYRDERWLKYPQSIYDTTMTATIDSGWNVVGNFPPNWNTGSWVPPTDIIVVAFCDEACAPNWTWDDDFHYHSCDIADGFGPGGLTGDTAQPTSYWYTDYNEFTGTTYGSFDTFKGVIYPIIKSVAGEALVLQAVAAIEGTILSPSEITALNSPVDLSPLLTTNPYSGDTALSEFGWQGVYDKVSPASDVFSASTFANELNELLLGIDEDASISVLAPEIDDNTSCGDFTEKVSTELIDVKNRKTIQSYPTLKTLYERYLNRALAYSDNQSSQFNYTNTDVFGQTIGNYWVDLIEQVVPSTSLWKSTYEYRNTIYDQQKFRYKKYSSFFCTSNVDPSSIASQTGITVTTETLVQPRSRKAKPTPSTCTGIWIKNYDIGSTFWGTVEITNPSENDERVVNLPNSKVISEEYYYNNLE